MRVKLLCCLMVFFLLNLQGEETFWRSGKNKLIDNEANWSNGLPLKGKVGIVNGDAEAHLGKWTRGFYLELRDKTKLIGGSKIANSKVVLKNSSSWSEGDLVAGFGGSLMIEVIGPKASFSFKRFRVHQPNQEGVRIVQTGGFVEGTLPEEINYIFQAGKRVGKGPLNFTPKSTGVAWIKHDGTLDGTHDNFKDSRYRFGWNQQDFNYLDLKWEWQRGAYTVNGFYGLPFEQVFDYKFPVGIRVKKLNPLNSNKKIILKDSVLRFDVEKVNPAQVIKLVQSGRVIWHKGKFDSPIGTEKVIKSWKNKSGVKLYLSESALWPEKENIPQNKVSLVESELEIPEGEKIYPSMVPGEAWPIGEVNDLNPWLHFNTEEKGPFVFRLSKSRSFDKSLVSKPQASSLKPGSSGIHGEI